MLGVHFIVKRIKKMEHKDSVHIIEIIQYIIQTLLKYITNEYMIEWVRKVVDVLVTDDEGEDVSVLTNEQKYSFIVRMI